VEALRRQAVVLYEAGRPEAALQVCRRMLAAEPDRVDVLGFAGMIATELGANGEAAALYQRAVAAKPDFVEAHYNLANALRGLGRLDEAEAAYRRAIEIRPELAQAYHNLGGVLHGQGRLEEAAGAYRQALELMPSAAESERNLGLVLEEAGANEAAVAAYRRALAVRPEWVDAHANLTNALVRQGDMPGALAAVEAWLKHDPASTEAMSLKALALHEIGAREETAYLLDFDRFVRRRRVASPPGFADLAAFNRALSEHVRGHPTLRVPPEDHPTYHHPSLRITEELLVAPMGPVAALEASIREAIEAYGRELAAASNHPFAAGWPRRWRLSSWGVVLEGQGNLVPHIHFDGYLGGVYYVEVPDVAADPAAERAGWFELGRPPPDLGFAAEPEVRAIQPEEGTMLLFPGYFYHRTLPFQSRDRRISIAFDLVPER